MADNRPSRSTSQGGGPRDAGRTRPRSAQALRAADSQPRRSPTAEVQTCSIMTPLWLAAGGGQGSTGRGLAQRQRVRARCWCRVTANAGGGMEWSTGQSQMAAPQSERPAPPISAEAELAGHRTRHETGKRNGPQAGAFQGHAPGRRAVLGGWRPRPH